MDQKDEIDAFKGVPITKGGDLLKKVFELDIGEIVEIVRSNGDKVKARFYKSQGNRIELKTLPLE